eukprot:6389159-Lingulodinium_polyedra.AAC.1
MFPEWSVTSQILVALLAHWSHRLPKGAKEVASILLHSIVEGCLPLGDLAWRVAKGKEQFVEVRKKEEESWQINVVDRRVNVSLLEVVAKGL